jgi:murein L,D-transpeptidase YcbB/YkuD
MLRFGIFTVATFCAHMALAQDVPLPAAVEDYKQAQEEKFSKLLKGAEQTPLFAKTAAQARAALPKGERVIVVNLPNQMLYALEADGSVAEAIKIGIGKAETPTPITKGKVTSIKYFPDWTASPSIALERIDFRVTQGSAVVKDLSDGSIWRPDRRVEDLFIAVKQDETGSDTGEERQFSTADITGQRAAFYIPPSNTGPMGQLKFEISGTDGYYLHDTPDHSVFDGNDRLVSHGCVRVSDMPNLAAWINGVDVNDISAKIEIEEMRYEAARSVDVYFPYFLETDFEGSVQSHSDVYGLMGE